MNPKCMCGATMKQHVMVTGVGFALLDRFSCPFRTFWNFWKHTPACSTGEARAGLTVL